MKFKREVNKVAGKVSEDTKKKILKFALSVPLWLLVLGVAAIATGLIRIAILTGNRTDQYMAKYWGQGSATSYRQMSVFAKGSRSAGETSPFTYVDANSSLRSADVVIIRQALQNIVDSGKPKSQTGLDTDGSPNGWEDCYSTTLQSTLTDKVYDGTTDAEVVGVGGNFTAFHPFKFLSGGFLPTTVQDSNQIVLNDVAAWKFYRSYDVVGNQVTLFDATFTVIGVVKEPSDSLAQSAGTTDARCYIYFPTLENLAVSSTEPSGDDTVADVDSGGGQEQEDSALAVQCYEAMLPEVVSGVAVSDVKNSLPNYNALDPGVYVLSNTGRFTIPRVWTYMLPIGAIEAAQEGFEFPYWEKAAQLAVMHLFVCYILVAVGIVLLVVGGAALILKTRGKKNNESDVIIDYSSESED